MSYVECISLSVTRPSPDIVAANNKNSVINSLYTSNITDKFLRAIDLSETFPTPLRLLKTHIYYNKFI